MQQLPIFPIAPGMMIDLTVISINFFGDGPPDALDPTGGGETGHESKADS